MTTEAEDIARQCDERVAEYDIEAVVHRLADACRNGRGWRGYIEPGDMTRYQVGITPPGPGLPPLVVLGIPNDMVVADLLDAWRVSPSNNTSAALWRRLTTEVLARIESMQVSS